METNQAGDGLRVCVDQRLPMHLLPVAARRAVEETETNRPRGQLEVERRPGLDSNVLETFGAMLTGKRWRNGRTLRVGNLNGNPEIHHRTAHIAKVWENFANITFDFGNHANAEIRISYSLDHQSYSFIGTDALVIPGHLETMHYGWLRADTPDDEFHRVVLHEFGHALGMIHEHQHPDTPINWKKQVVYDYYARLGWSREEVDQNVFAASSRLETQFTQYDPTSIMHYPVPPEFTTDNQAVGWNIALSQTDKDFVSQVYPRAAATLSFPPATALPAAAASPAGASIRLVTRRWE